ncbi:MAG: queuosine precursor transporter [Bacteroidales bacterium]|nr:queuosine precursor transporter [Bacteroidales bacterium]
MTKKIMHAKAWMKNQAGSKVSSLYMALGVLSATCFVASNILTSKQITGDWLGDIRFTGGLLLFPITYIIGDVTTEVYGLRAARRIIIISFLMNLLVVLAGALAVALPSANDTSSQAFETIFRINGGRAVVLMSASMLSFVLGSLANAKVMQMMHDRDGARHFSLRAILSTVVGEGVDSLIFFPVCFFPIVRLGEMTWGNVLQVMLLQIVLKTIYEIIVLPITIQVVKYVRSMESSTEYYTPR